MMSPLILTLLQFGIRAVTEQLRLLGSFMALVMHGELPEVPNDRHKD